MITDEMIAEAIAKYNDALVQYWQNVEMEEYEFSSKFERKMRRLIWKVKYPYMHKALKSAACILIAFLISFASVMTFDVEARAAFTRWIREVYKDSIVYEFFGEKSETASLDYRVTWVPGGYELVQEYKTDLSYTALYQQGEDIKNAFIFKCFYLTDGRKVQYLTGDQIYKYKKVNILGQKADFYQAVNEEQANSVIWINEKYNLCFAIDAYLDEEIIIKIAESVKK